MIEMVEIVERLKHFQLKSQGHNLDSLKQIPNRREPQFSNTNKLTEHFDKIYLVYVVV